MVSRQAMPSTCAAQTSRLSLQRKACKLSKRVADLWLSNHQTQPYDSMPMSLGSPCVSHSFDEFAGLVCYTLGCGVKGRGGRIGRVTDSEDCWGALSVADGPATSLQIAHVNDDTNCCAILMGGGIAKRRSKCGGKRCECIGRWLAR